jgi:glycogen debranching enzyme
MYNPAAGIRNYAIGTVFNGGTNYHGSSHTYWPFASTMVARGLESMGYHNEAIRVSTAVLRAISFLGSNIEMFIEEPDGSLSPWHHPLLNQQSATEQAWTAAAVYYNCTFLLADELS